ncbi:hypothetical protein [Caldivirga maquilingensis]|uniref:hypothetical protein n=1 Tax=Caldivirga maquilingensis TaxID=76887 RepID=UPI00064F4175|nr:hypothetical protein [Caldivirga maquilingensis]
MRPLITITTAVVMVIALVAVFAFTLINHGVKHEVNSQYTYIIMEYKPFFPSYGTTSEATPITALWSNKTAIVVQDALWLSWAGVDAILIDWSPVLGVNYSS